MQRDQRRFRRVHRVDGHTPWQSELILNTTASRLNISWGFLYHDFWIWISTFWILISKFFYLMLKRLSIHVSLLNFYIKFQKLNIKSLNFQMNFYIQKRHSMFKWFAIKTYTDSVYISTKEAQTSSVSLGTQTTRALTHVHTYGTTTWRLTETRFISTRTRSTLSLKGRALADCESAFSHSEYSTEVKLLVKYVIESRPDMFCSSIWILVGYIGAQEQNYYFKYNSSVLLDARYTFLSTFALF